MTVALPAWCLLALPGLPAGANVVMCVQGEQGVRLTSLDFGSYVAARRTVRALNRSLDIDETAERSMLIGCLIGWRAAAQSTQVLH